MPISQLQMILNQLELLEYRVNKIEQLFREVMADLRAYAKGKEQ